MHLSPRLKYITLYFTPEGHAPGNDELTAEFYRHHQDLLLPILFAIYLETLRSGPSPNFLHGIITLLYKDGDRSDHSNYRPITLRNLDYKILAYTSSMRD